MTKAKSNYINYVRLMNTITWMKDSGRLHRHTKIHW